MHELWWQQWSLTLDPMPKIDSTEQKWRRRRQFVSGTTNVHYHRNSFRLQLTSRQQRQWTQSVSDTLMPLTCIDSVVLIWAHSFIHSQFTAGFYLDLSSVIVSFVYLGQCPQMFRHRIAPIHCAILCVLLTVRYGCKPLTPTTFTTLRLWNDGEI